MAAQKKKTVPVIDRKGKKPAGMTVTEHISRCPTPGYPEDKGRRKILMKKLEQMGCAMLWKLPWRYAGKKMAREIVA
jgi:hypothetical protein